MSKIALLDTRFYTEGIHLRKIEQGQLWRTRNGRTYRVLATDSPADGQPIVAMAVDTGMLARYTADGRYWPSGPDTDYDLAELFVPPLEAEGWAIATDRIGKPAGLTDSGAVLLLYSDRNEAERVVMRGQGERVIKVRVTEVRE